MRDGLSLYESAICPQNMFTSVMFIVVFSNAQRMGEFVSSSGKTSNGNLVLSQMIFDNPNNDTYFREIMFNLKNFPEKKLYSA